ncbi:MAG: hypothetical protein IJ881_02140 [Neisseriaceae bacterium]|nr:hypothetical protein [Neisseriaceae bacterium]
MAVIFAYHCNDKKPFRQPEKYTSQRRWHGNLLAMENGFSIVGWAFLPT